MSELAFDGNGEPIAFPSDAEELRVRRFRNPGMRGACEVVHDRDGAPLYVPVDSSYVEFRKLVDGVPGRYRLDPVDATRRVIAGSIPAYVTIGDGPRNATSGGMADDRDSVIRELARANADMTKTIADRFASVMQAAADLLRAADGAGLPKREPVAVPPAAPAPVVADDQEEDEDLDDDDLGPDVARLIAQILPTIQMWLATKAADKSAPAATPPAAPSASAPTSAPATAPAAAPVPAVGEAAAAAGEAASATPPAGGADPVTTANDTPRNASALPSPAQTAHLLAIYQQLAPDEQRIAQLVVTRMSPELRAEWLSELSDQTVEQAVALVRSMIPKPRREDEA